MPRANFVRASKSDIPDDFEIEFVPTEPGYDLEPRKWYPLAVGNAWLYRK